MIRSKGVKLLSCHLVNNAWKSIYEGVFQKTLNSRVVGGEGGVRHVVNLHKRMLSIRASASLSLGNSNDYDMSKAYHRISFEDFCKGFEKWCKDHDKTFSSDEDRRETFQWFLDTYKHNYPIPVLYTGGCPDPPARDALEIFKCIVKYGLSDNPHAVTKVLVEKLRRLPAYMVLDMKEEDFKHFVLAHFRKS